MHLKEWVLYSSKFSRRRTESLMLLEGSCAKQVIQKTSIFLILLFWGSSIVVFLDEDKIRHYSLTQKRKLKALSSVLTVTGKTTLKGVVSPNQKSCCLYSYGSCFVPPLALCLPGEQSVCWELAMEVSRQLGLWKEICCCCLQRYRSKKNNVKTRKIISSVHPGCRILILWSIKYLYHHGVNKNYVNSANYQTLSANN